MIKNDRFYAFVIAGASSSRAQVRKISIHPRLLKTLFVLLVVLFGAAVYGFYSLAQQARHARLARENNRLREENEQQRQQLGMLKNRVDAVEDASRRLAEMSGLELQQVSARTRGAGGPRLPINEVTIDAVEQTARHLERELTLYEAALRRERAALPSLWPVAGSISDVFGGRRDPFGGGASEFHSGQDIVAAWGTPVVAAGGGEISFAGWQGGYGSVVIIEHGGGLTTRYAHLSKIRVTAGDRVERGQQIGDIGSTGRSTGPHLHYEVRLYDTAVDPRRYLSELLPTATD